MGHATASARPHRPAARLVLKFGGSSMGSPEKILHVARRVAARVREVPELVVVVSAMQGETDRLLALARQTADAGAAAEPDARLARQRLREGDQLLATGEQASAALLALALGQLGVPAKSFSGAQMRLYTDGNFARARLKQLDKALLEEALANGEVVVATGFQGVDARGNVTTLGRGGSDTSAVALAAVLGAQACEIFTDVDGVYTADPRICPEARALVAISGDEMLEMASLGAKVLQIRSVELAMNHNVPVRVRSTFTEGMGTLVSNDAPEIERVNVVGVSHALNEAQINVRGLAADGGAVATLFTKLSEAGINVDVIVQNVPQDGLLDLSFTMAHDELKHAEKVLCGLKETLGYSALQLIDDVGKVSIVGVGMMSHPGVAAQMFSVLYAEKITPKLISTSEIKLTCVVARKDVARAVPALHAAFGLGAHAKKREAT